MDTDSLVKTVFVSSTFKDMQAERDILRDRVLPELCEFAGQYGKTVEMVDLRWGVDTASVSEGVAGTKLLRTCFDEIDRSRPFFIVLLGGRYGWIPEKEEVDKAFSYLEYKLEAHTGQSVTALEVEYGAFHSERQPVCFFYFRDPIGECPDEAKSDYYEEGERERKLEALKTRIKEKYADRVRTYTGVWRGREITELDGFARMVCDDLTAAFREEWGEPSTTLLTWQEEEERAIEQVCQVKLRRFTGRSAEVDRLVRHALSRQTEQRIMMLFGDSGSGKSAVICKTIGELKKADCLVLPFLCGITPRASILENLLEMMIFRLSEYSEESESDLNLDFKQLCSRLSELLGIVSKNRRVVLVVDALNQLQPCEEGLRLLWLHILPHKNVRVVLSCVDPFSKEARSAYDLGAKTAGIGALSEEESTQVIAALAAGYHKELDKRLIPHILGKHTKEGAPALRSPLYLSLMIHSLVLMDRYDHATIDRLAKNMKAEDAIYKYMADIIDHSPDNSEGVYLEIVHRLCDLLGREFVLYCLYLIAYSRQGLRETDIEGALRATQVSWGSADFALLRQSLRGHMVQRDFGQWDFSHTSLRNAIQNSGLLNEQTLQTLFSSIAQVLCQDGSAFAHRELMHHCRIAEKPDLAVDAICAATEQQRHIYAEGLSFIAVQEDIDSVRDGFLYAIISHAAIQEGVYAICFPGRSRTDAYVLPVCKAIRSMFFSLPSTVSVSYCRELLVHAAMLHDASALLPEFILFFSSLLVRLCDCFVLTNASDDALKCAAIVVEMLDKIDGSQLSDDELRVRLHEFRWDAYSAMSRVCGSLSMQAESVRYAEMAFEEAKLLFTHDSDASALRTQATSMALTYHQAGEYEKAKAFRMLALESDENNDLTVADTEYPETAVLLVLEAEEQIALDDPESAEQTCGKSISIAMEWFNTTADTKALFVAAMGHALLATCHLKKRDSDKAIGEYRKAYELYERHAKATGQPDDALPMMDV